MGQDGQRAVIFSAVDEPVRVSLVAAAAGAGYDLTVERVAMEAQPVPLGERAAQSSAGSVGALVDEAIYKINVGQGDEFEIVRGLLAKLHEVDQGPVITSQGVLFFGPGSDQEPAPQLRGSFTQWQPASFATLSPLTGRLYARYIKLEPAYHEYKLVFNDGAAWYTDLANRHLRWDGINTQSTGGFNSVLWPQLRAQASTTGRMVWAPQVHAQALNNTREVYIYLPPGYDDDLASSYATLYVHDGNESIVRSQLHEVADAWIGAQAERRLLMVFVGLPTQDVRIAEYTMGTPEARGDQYASFIAGELVPWVGQQLRARDDAAARGVVGASLGGLISYWIGINYPTIFEYIAGMSSSFWWEDELILAELEQRGCQGLRYYLDSGEPADNSVSTRQMRDLLARLGCSFTHREEPGGQHDWLYWKGRFPGVLEAFVDAANGRP